MQFQGANNLGGGLKFNKKLTTTVFVARDEADSWCAL